MILENANYVNLKMGIILIRLIINVILNVGIHLRLQMKNVMMAIY